MRTAGPTLRLVNNGATNDIIDNALVRYHDYLFSEVTGGLSQWLGPTPGAPPRRCSNHSGATSTKALALEQLSVHVKNVSAAAFGMDGDESYVLDIPASGDAVLVANTPVGALRGLETFSQLFLLTREECHYRIPLVPIHVEDSPRWTHRGLLVDTGRDYQSVSKLKAIIETLRCAAVPQPPPMTPHPAGYGCG
jgi:hypothetical protein